MKQLTQKELRFIDIYTNPDSSTFGNKTRSYMVAYDNPNEGSSSVLALRVLGKVKVKRKMEELMEKSEVKFEAHINTLNKKLKSLADSGMITREELGAIRLVGEVEGKLGSGTKIGIGINTARCNECPHNKPIFDEDILLGLPPIEVGSVVVDLPNTEQIS